MDECGSLHATKGPCGQAAPLCQSRLFFSDLCLFFSGLSLCVADLLCVSVSGRHPRLCAGVF